MRVEDGSTASTATRLAAVDQMHAQRLDGGGPAYPRNPGDAHPVRISGVGQQIQQQLLGPLAVVGTSGLQHCDCSGQRGAITAVNGLG